MCICPKITPDDTEYNMEIAIWKHQQVPNLKTKTKWLTVVLLFQTKAVR